MPEKLLKPGKTVGKQVDRESFICNSCSYKFSRDKGTFMTRKCPYCGKESVVAYKPLTADYFLKTVRTSE